MHFAEFLDHSSLERLGILYLTTCVGLGYGSRRNSLEAFLGSMGSLYFASNGYASRLSLMVNGFACPPAYTLAPALPLAGGAALLRHPIAWLLPGGVPRSPRGAPEGDTRGSGG